MRTIFIGDIHGCIDELRELYERVSPVAGDQVISVGDIVAKGPASGECVDFLIASGCLAVIGNQDRKWLRRRLRERWFGVRGRVTEEERWLGSLPLWLALEDRGVLVVHGGLLPDREIDEQEDTLTRLRYIRRGDSGGWEAVPKGKERPGDVFWADVWNGERAVVYGHSPAPSGQPRVIGNTFGIDTGCVYGGALTAAILENGRWEFVSVRARRSYASPN
jgi:diadenosine tetraphosphatase ApaH/serine/threonine PP2A family protein phosphatase